MNRAIIRTAGAALILTLIPGGGAAQSLVEIARREAARRAAIAPEDRAPVLTNDDLRSSGGLTIGSLPAAGRPEADAGSGRAGRGVDADGGEGEGGAGAGADGGDVPGEDAWRMRMTAAVEAQSRAALLAEALQNRADGLWAEFTAVDDPARRRVVERQRVEALAELERTTADASRLEQEIRGIREAARRAGVPPGWLR